MSGRERYVMLMASLPAIRFLADKTLPINAARLAERLRLLEPDDRDELLGIASIISWNRIDTGDDDAGFVARAASTIAGIRSVALRDAVLERLEIRTVVAALRRRASGEDAPPVNSNWGLGPHVETIRRNWTMGDFGLSRVYPWLMAAKEKLDQRDASGLERLILDVTWNAAARREFGHAFDLEAVAFYLMRWQLADRWARYDADAAALRFRALLEAALSDRHEVTA